MFPCAGDSPPGGASPALPVTAASAAHVFTFSPSTAHQSSADSPSFHAGDDDTTYAMGQAVINAMSTSASPAPTTATFPTSPSQMESLSVDLNQYATTTTATSVNTTTTNFSADSNSRQAGDNTTANSNNGAEKAAQHWIVEELAKERSAGTGAGLPAPREIKVEKPDPAHGARGAGDEWAVCEEPVRKFKRGRLPINNKGMTPYELMKKERRREQNRRAARKCREKRKKQQDLVYEDYQRLQEENEMLYQQCEDYKVQLEQLVGMLQAHEASCTSGGHFAAYSPEPSSCTGARPRHVSTSSSNYDTSFSQTSFSPAGPSQTFSPGPATSYSPGPPPDCMHYSPGGNSAVTTQQPAPVPETSITPPMLSYSNQPCLELSLQAMVEEGDGELLPEEITEFVFSQNKV